jgi:hypothetical protein
METWCSDAQLKRFQCDVPRTRHSLNCDVVGSETPVTLQQRPCMVKNVDELWIMRRLVFLTKLAYKGHGKVELGQKRNLRITSETSLPALHVSMSTMNDDCNTRPSPKRSSRGME